MGTYRLAWTLSVSVAIALLFSLSGCSVIRNKLEPQALYGDFQAPLDRFTASDIEAAKPGAVAAQLKDYVDAGTVLSDAACRAWLATLSNSDREIGFTQSIMNIAGNAFVGVAGLNGVSAANLGRFSIGLGAANASIDTYRSDIILG
jgi:hypothetical protein